MSSVGIRELKNKLSYYIRRVKEGDKLAITDRGKTVAFITPAKETKEMEKVISLIKAGKGIWEGGKPNGSEHPVKISGKPISQIVIEDRR